MAVAVKNTPDVGPNPLDRLPVVSLVGVAYVLGSLGIVFGLLPALWWNVLGFSKSSFAAASLLGVVMFAVAVGLAILGGRGLAVKLPHGARAGIFVGLVGLLLVLLLTRWASIWIEYWSFNAAAFSPAAGLVAVAVVGLALLGVALWFFFQRSTDKLLIQIEDQGWFSATSYKPLQGQRVRRGTILGILLLAGAGIYTLLSHQILRRGTENWDLNVPFTGRVVVTSPGDAADQLKQYVIAEKPGQPLVGGNPVAPAAGEPQMVLDRYEFQRISEEFNPATHVKIVLPGDSKFKVGEIVRKSDFEAERRKVEADGGTVPPPKAPEPPAGTTEFRRLTLLPAVQYTVPLLVLAAGIWLAWRVVNLPVFADFLIATEAEINKVSWTTRKRLAQDTIVVLVTVVLMAGFLFTTDVVWKVLLGSKVVHVLQINEQHQETTDRDRPLW
jgi:preprotein translocase SecE subunit